jgi:D-alanyl-D-alanine carboxypeptidase (penicillin-binding protein 5/6)
MTIRLSRLLRVCGTAWPTALQRPVLAVAVILAVTAPAAAAAAATPPPIKAKAALIMDARTGRILWAFNANVSRPMASTTKIMTARIVLLHVRDLNAVVTAHGDVTTVDESTIGLHAGDRLTVMQLLEGLLIPSANDAAVDLADYVGGSQSRFVAMMNAEARRLGLTHTHYANPHGLDAPGHYSTVADLTRLARIEMRDPVFAFVVKRTRAELPGPADHPRQERIVRSPDTLLYSYPWVKGVKTGMTDDAGWCVVSYGHRSSGWMYVTVLGEPTPARRQSDVVALYRYGTSLYTTWSSPPAGAVQARVPVPYSHTPLSLVVSKAFTTGVPPGAQVTWKVEAPAAAHLPLAAGQALGTMRFFIDGHAVGSRPLLADRSVPAPSWWHRDTARLHDAWGRRGHVVHWLHQAGSWIVDRFRDLGQRITSLF